MVVEANDHVRVRRYQLLIDLEEHIHLN
jgi:hypothetical protein